jgi:hypothetical protein
VSRPSDWSPLQLSDDPVPGDWGAVRSASSRYGRVADSIDQAKTDLLSAFADDSMTGESIEAMREVALQVADRIERAWDRYRGVADALGGYVEPLRTAQNDSLVLLQRASETQSERLTAEHWVRHWQSEHQRRAFAGEPDVDEAFDRWQYWEGQLRQTQQDVGGAIAALNRVIEARDTAADIAAGLIEEVENTGDINDDFWDKVDQFLTENPWIDGVIQIASYVAAALAVIAMFVPGLNVLVLVVSIIVAAAVIANAWAKAGTGRISLVEAIVTTALAIIPFGVGKVLGNAASASRGAVSTTATNAVMGSAAGSGVSGITRPIASNVVAQFLTRQPGLKLSAASDFGQLLNLSVLAKTPILLSGNASSAVAATMPRAVTTFVAEFGYNAFGGAADGMITDLVVPENAESNSWQNADW